jgi:ribonuclease J
VVNEAVVRDRLLIGSEGIFTIIVTADKKTGRLLKHPDIISRACVYLEDSKQLCDDIRRHIRRTVTLTKLNNEAKLRSELANNISNIIYDVTGLLPLVTTVVNRV